MVFWHVTCFHRKCFDIIRILLAVTEAWVRLLKLYHKTGLNNVCACTETGEVAKGFSKHPHIFVIFKVDSEVPIIFLLFFAMNKRRRTNEASLLNKYRLQKNFLNILTFSRHAQYVIQPCHIISLPSRLFWRGQFV